jgi:hypothetical protein
MSVQSQIDKASLDVRQAVQQSLEKAEQQAGQPALENKQH